MHFLISAVTETATDWLLRIKETLRWLADGSSDRALRQSISDNLPDLSTYQVALILGVLALAWAFYACLFLHPEDERRDRDVY